MTEITGFRSANVETYKAAPRWRDIVQAAIARAYWGFVLDRGSRRVTNRAPLQSSTGASSTNCLAHTIASSSLSHTKPRCRLNLPS